MVSGRIRADPKGTAKKVQEFISKFRQDPTSNGLNYEKIHDARSKMSIRCESIKLIAALF